jgi:hypothetical protein
MSDEQEPYKHWTQVASENIAASKAAQRDEQLTPEQRAYRQSMVDGMLDHSEEQSQRDPVTTAVDNSYRNIHEKFRAEMLGDGVPVADAAPAAESDLDTNAAVSELGLDADVFKTLKFETADEFTNAIGPALEQMEAGVSDDAVAAAMEQYPGLVQELLSAIDSARSPAFGRSIEQRTAAQIRATCNAVSLPPSAALGFCMTTTISPASAAIAPRPFQPLAQTTSMSFCNRILTKKHLCRSLTF